MKNKLVYFLITILLFCLFTGCSSKDSNSAIEDDSSMNDVNIDIDMTLLSSTMMYAEIDNISSNPEKYSGDIIKMRGMYRVLPATMSDKLYTFVAVYDETLCCEVGIEFRVSGDYVFPDDYPLEDTEIEVTGEYKSHNDFDMPYYYIETDKIVIIE